MKEYIILDLETTGLDLEHSAIIEVGAILIQNNSIKGSYSSLIRYRDPLPETVKRITGITEDMLRDAPPLETVLAELKAFVKKLPVVSHNGFSFDFPILEREGVKFNEKFDSMEFAFFVLPTSVHGHSATALCQQFGMSEVRHRAIEDCGSEFEMIRKLQAEWSKRPKKHREALKHAALRTQWWWSEFLLGKAIMADHISNLVADYEPYRKEKTSQEILAFEAKSIDLTEVDKYFVSTRSSSDDEMDYSEDRPEQRKMAAKVAAAFNERKHAVIEAGTGTGKSKAYLVPSLLFASKNAIPVIISTHTKVLQDQLFLKEIQHLRATINPDLQVAVLKGKKNYVCLKKFEEFEEEIMTEFAQRSLYAFGEDARYTTPLAYLLLASWILATERGDWDELPYWFKERIAKKVELEVCNIDELCSNSTCELYEAQKCFLAKARHRSRDADLVIVNHALTLSGIILEDNDRDDIQASSGDTSGDDSGKSYSHTVFPGEAKFIVFDEAHHLEDDATSAWEHIISEGTLQLILQQLYGKRGIISFMDSLVRGRPDGLFEHAERFRGKEGDIRLVIQTVFERILPQLVSKSAAGNFSTYAMLDEIPETSSLRNALFDSLQNLRDHFKDIIRILDKFSDEAKSAKISKIFSVRAQSLQRTVESLHAILENDRAYVRYLERSGSVIEIKAAPLSVSGHLRDYVYKNFSSVVLTSATLTVDRKFNFFASRCGTNLIEVEKVGYHLFKSSFDYERQVQFFVPKGIAYENNSQEHFEKSAAFLERAILASNGGALVLCSSHEQIGKLYDRLITPLSKNNIWLLRQTKNMSVSSVVRDFKKDVNSVLIGTESLWQGIDVPGETLRSLFIYKIPYRMPNFPLIRARRRELEDNERNSFSEYYEPLAALILKQGFGRLIRKSTDKGIAVLLDENLLRKPQLLRSLPEGVKPCGADPEDIYVALSAISHPVSLSAGADELVAVA